ncbi:hypothetical protein POSPLADRAFT_1046085 [Postia placenta MAD-698-R-SB12]|uniref:Uncharacterized protein n=1 Tax=Postia placenta MAD-698-R-SB12 TaxID=670580 RepID=A0A1X6N208_9APHY|nr:hypothetical protein POSPLADRAFT_1046085 [Postia placenta MAD-698-R-SB12]OSX62659.1 hypothetical protein POSPLADRAFT_1046085 [Postia placenta MAD-698-R-SB12]
MANSGLASTAGSTFIGVLLGLILYGCSCAQIVIYFRRYSEDPLGLKALAATLWYEQKCGSRLLFTWHLLVASHAAPAKLAVGTSYYIHVVWKPGGWPQSAILRRNTCLCGNVVPFTSSGSGNSGNTRCIRNRCVYYNFFMCDSPWTQNWDQEASTTLMATSRTENVIATLVIYAINRGIFTAYVANFMTINGAHISVLFQALPTGAFYHLHLLQDAVVILVDDRPRPGHSAYVMLLLLGERGAELTYPCSPPVYVNSLLALLNVRQNLRGQMAGPEHVSMTLRNHERLPGNDGTLPGPKIALKFAH